MKVESVNNWIQPLVYDEVRVEGAFIIIRSGEISFYLNNDGREVLRVTAPATPRKHWWLRLQDWLNRKFPRRSPEEIAKLAQEPV